ncbi:MAG: PRC-barrel domain-containing protein [Deltaproteobacteria bacterium]|nr:PRC-barrel domain-containing protein [Deltaproteobacteria bacterium]
MKQTSESLRGRTVIGSDGRLIGDITQLVIDDITWRIEAINVKLRKDVATHIGAGWSVFHAATVEIPTSKVQSVGDAVILAMTVDDLRQVLPDVTGPEPAVPLP